MVFQYFSYIMAVSFIDGGNQSTQRKPLICRNLSHRQTLSHNVVSSTEVGLKLTTLVAIDTDYILGSYKI